MSCRLVHAAVLCILMPAAGSAADIWDEPFIDTIDDQEAIAEDNISALAEDRSGLLWVGTPNGLLRFDGYRFKSYSHPAEDPQSLRDSFVRRLAVDGEGQLWIGTNAAGVSVLDPASGHLRHLDADSDAPRRLPSNAVRALALDPRGGVWIGTLGGLAYAEAADRVASVALPGAGADPDPAAQIAALAIDRSGRLWIGSARGLFKRHPESGEIALVSLRAALGLGAEEPAIRSLLAAADGSVWVGSLDATVVRIDASGRRFDAMSLPDDAGDAPPKAIKPLAMVQIDADSVWLGGSDGLSRCPMDGHRCESPRLHDPLTLAGFVDPDIRALLLDRSGQLWIGGYGSGLQRLNAGNHALRMLRFRPGDPHGLGNPSISAVFADADGTLFLGTRGDGIEIVDPERGVVARLPPTPTKRTGLADGEVTALQRTRDGRLWAGTDYGLTAFDYPAGGSRRYRREDGLPSNTIRRLFEDRSGRLWVGTNAGLASLDAGRNLFVPVPSERGGNWQDGVNALAESEDGSLWIGAMSGLHVISGGETSIRLAGDPSAEYAPSSVVGLLADPRGGLWIDRSDGLQYMSGWDGKRARFESISAKLGIAAQPFGANLLRDELGRLWSPRYVYDPNNQTLPELGRADGADLGTAWFRAYAKDRSGRLYFGGSRGLLRITPDEFTPWEYEPPLVITELRIDGRSLPVPAPDTTVSLAPGQNSISVEFAALDYSAPQRLLYQYRLVGHDTDWISTDAGHRVASYAGLWPGEYRLKVRGSNRAGRWSPHEIDLVLRVQPAFWQRPAFAFAAVMLLAGLVALAVWVNARRLHQRALELQLLVNERTAALGQAKQRAESALLELGDTRRQLAASEKMAAFGLLAQRAIGDARGAVEDAIAAMGEVAQRLRESQQALDDAGSGGSLLKARLDAADSALQAATLAMGQSSALLRELQRIARG